MYEQDKKIVQINLRLLLEDKHNGARKMINLRAYLIKETDQKTCTSTVNDLHSIIGM